MNALKLLIFALVICLASIACTSPARRVSGGSSDKIIRVSLGDPTHKINIRSYGVFDLSLDGKIIRKPSSSYLIRQHSGHLTLNGQPSRSLHVRFEGRERDNIWEINGGQYRGSVYVYAEKDNRIRVVVHVPLEDYVAGVVAGESGRGFSMEALKVQAVASRTFAWFRKRHERRSERYDVFDDTRDQVFRDLNQTAGRHVEATEKTLGQVLTWQGKVLGTFYHSTCGGHTVDAHQLGLTFNEVKPLKGVDCHYCKISPVYRWTAQLSKSKITAKYPQLTGSDFDVIDHKRKPYGDVESVVIGRMNSRQEVPFETLKTFTVKGSFRSRHFTLKNGTSTLTVSGSGYGHGAGLCQFGAEGMSQEGHSYQDILRHYYPGSLLKKLK